MARRPIGNTLLYSIVLFSAVLNVLNYSPLAWNVLGVNIAIFRGPLIGAFLLWVLANHRVARDVLARSPLVVWVLPIIALLSGAAAFPQVKPVAYAVWLVLAFGAMYCFLESRGGAESALNSTIKVIFVANIVPVILGAAAIPGYVAGNEARLLALGEMDQFNSIAAVVELASGYWILKQRLAKSRLVYLSVIAMMLLSVPNILLSGTRTAILGFAIFLALAIVIPQGKKGSVAVKSLLVFVIVSVVYVSSQFTNQSTIDRVSESREKSYSMQIREEIALANLSIAKDYPIFGVGLTRSRDIVGEYGGSNVEGFSPHSTPVGVLSELGFVGIVGFALFSFAAVKRGLSRRPMRPLRAQYLSILTPLFAMSLFEYNLSPGQFLFYPLFLFLILPLVRWNRSL